MEMCHIMFSVSSVPSGKYGRYDDDTLQHVEMCSESSADMLQHILRGRYTTLIALAGIFLKEKKRVELQSKHV